MKSRRLVPAFVVAVALPWFFACGEEDLKSGPTCPEGQHQECEGDDDSVRCTCVREGEDAGADGLPSDANPADANSD